MTCPSLSSDQRTTQRSPAHRSPALCRAQDSTAQQRSSAQLSADRAAGSSREQVALCAGLWTRSLPPAGPPYFLHRCCRYCPEICYKGGTPWPDLSAGCATFMYIVFELIPPWASIPFHSRRLPPQDQQCNIYNLQCIFPSQHSDYFLHCKLSRTMHHGLGQQCLLSCSGGGQPGPNPRRCRLGVLQEPDWGHGGCGWLGMWLWRTPGRGSQLTEAHGGMRHADRMSKHADEQADGMKGRGQTDQSEAGHHVSPLAGIRFARAQAEVCAWCIQRGAAGVGQ